MNADRYELRPIGFVESPLTDPALAPKQGDEGSPDPIGLHRVGILDRSPWS